MLDLGLESLTTGINVSTVDVYRSELDVVRAEAEVMDAFRDVAECKKDMQNYMEIMNSLQVHSSQECMAFAADLLGMSVASLEEDAKPADGKKEKSGWDKFKQRARIAVGKTKQAVKKFFVSIWTWIKNTASKIWTAIKSAGSWIKKTPLRIKVWCTAAYLKGLTVWISRKAQKKANTDLGKFDELKKPENLETLEQIAEWQKAAIAFLKTASAAIDSGATDEASIRTAVEAAKKVVADNKEIVKEAVEASEPKQD